MRIFGILYLVWISLSTPILSETLISLSVFEYGKSNYPTKYVNSLNKKEYVSMSWLFYLIEDNENHKILIDCGFENKDFANKFGLSYFEKPDTLLLKENISPSSITDIIITHHHFDHAGGILLFPNAKIHIQKEEYPLWKYQVGFQKTKKTFQELEKRFHLIDTKSNLYNFLFINKSGGHTKGSQIVWFFHNGKKYIFTGDECYFSDACYKKIPLPQEVAYSTRANREFINIIQEEDFLLTLHDTIWTKENHSTHYRKILP